MNKDIMKICVVVLALAGPAAAQEAPQKRGLPDLLAEALRNNPQVRAAREDASAARSRIGQASALPDPTVGLSYMGRMLETPLGPQEDVYEFEQMVPFPGKLAVRRGLAKSESSAAQARRSMAEREIIFSVTQAYHDLYAVQETLKVMEEVKGVLMKYESIAQSRYASKSGSQRDVAKAQAEVSMTIEQILALRQQKESLEVLLNALLDCPQGGVFSELEAPRLPSAELSLEALAAAAAENRPELLEAKAMKERETFARNLARYENMPDFTVGLQYSRIGRGDGSMADDGRDAWMIPVKVTVPLWQNRIGSGIREANSVLNAARSRLEDTENMTGYELKNAFTRFLTQKQIVGLYENAYIPQAELAFHSDQAAYEAGNGDILGLLDSERTYLNAKVAYYQAMAEAMKSFAMLERVVGKDLPTEGGQP